MRAINLIDKDELREAVDGTDWYHLHDGKMVQGANSALHIPYFRAEDVYKVIYSAPTIDAVPVIRCKDCKHYYFAENRVPEEQSWVCDVWHVNQTAHMGYCFKAERRSDE